MSRSLLSALLIPLLAAPVIGRAHLPPELESRLQAIYEQHEYDVKRVGPGRWVQNDQAYLVLEPGADGKTRELVSYEPATGKREVLIAAGQLVSSDAKERFALEEFAVSKDLSRVLVFTNGHVDAKGIDVADLWVLERTTGTLRKVASDVEEPNAEETLSPDGTRLLYVHAHNLYVQDVRTGNTTQLTSDGMVGSIGNGVSDWGPAIARWSPEGQRIAYVQGDVREMGLFPLLNQTETIYPEVRYRRFPKVGTPITALRVVFARLIMGWRMSTSLSSRGGSGHAGRSHTRKSPAKPARFRVSFST